MSSTVLPVTSLPISDFSQFRSGDSNARKATAKHVVDGFKTFGFVYLVNHGISDSRVQELFDWSKKLFALPDEVKKHPDVVFPPTVPGKLHMRGYSPIGYEKLSQNIFDEKDLEKIRSVPDVKELFEMGPNKGPAAAREPNRYPPDDVLPGFQDFTQSFFWEAQALGLDILRCIALGLGLDEEYFANYHRDADNNFRLIRYPPVERLKMLAGQAHRGGPHTDFGSITILFQDDVGGLEVENPAAPGTYIQATPVQGSVIVNVADFLMRWTNNVLKSNLHRVVEPPADRELSDDVVLTKERYSVPFFIQADRTKLVKCAEGLEGDGAKYPPISPAEYLYKRINAAVKAY